LSNAVFYGTITKIARNGAIMRPTRYSAHAVKALILKQKIASLRELMDVLGTQARRTVFRKLKELSCRTSYSHRGGYYTIDEVTCFDELGLWSFNNVWFSIRGTLLETVRAFVEESEYGYFATELDNILHVATKDVLPKLVLSGWLSREDLGGQYIYCAAKADQKRRQLLARRNLLTQPGVTGPLPGPSCMPDELRAAIILFFSLLDEQQRRLYAGLEALKSGHGGDALISNLLGIDVGTVARGRRELLAKDVEIDRVRRSGGGRKPLEKKLPK
jgi:hypothetical protein